jgi:hypothetical protein
MTHLVLTLSLSLPLLAADFFPLENGNSWTYREPRSGREFTIRVTTPEMHNNHVYYSLHGYGATRLVVRLDDSGRLLHWDDELARDVPIISFQPFEGGWWHAPYRACPQDGQTRQQRVLHDGPAGPIPAALDIRYRTTSCADTGIEAEQFAENIGLLRRTETTIAGPVHFDLIHARIGKRLLHALPNGRFTVTVAERPGSDFLDVLLRLETSPASPLRLRFHSSQEFDLTLRDEDGHALWTWSATRLFLPVLQDRIVAGQWLIPVQVPRSVIPPGTTNILVEAWITTAIRPAFAAVAPVTLTAR